ncbi:acyltransferase family protein [Pseudomonas paeninsulae]|uniref:acyltransferase family protein n=1 Tax=Pseudomonas paeninsulae TaxID=3110772 RepID=UPI002D78F78B|nr:acyltransferase [Pseudomonas sp. IT1137]
MSKSRNTQIDAMRGLAAIAVAIYHLKLIAVGGPLQVPWWMDKITSLGGTGVALFFVLSAYLLTKITANTNIDSRWVAGFLVKRWFRIAPMFFFSFFAWVLYRSFFGGNLFPSDTSMIWTFSLMFNFSPTHAHTSIFAGWTVGVEFLFYLIFPALFILLKTKSHITLAIVFSLIIKSLAEGFIQKSGLSQGVKQQYMMINFFSHLPVFLIGMLIAKINTSNIPRSAHHYIFAISILIFYANLTGNLNVVFDYRTWNAIASALALYAATLMKENLTTKILAPLGTISFSIYLLHGPIFKSMGSTFIEIYSIGIGSFFSFLISCSVGLLAVALASKVTYELIEKPFMKIGRKLCVIIENKKPPII